MGAAAFIRHSVGAPNRAAMYYLLQTLALCLVGGALLVAEARADEPQRPDPPGQRCLSAAEQRAAVSAKRAMPLASALKMVRRSERANLVNARLCEVAGKLIYEVTLLRRDGKVRRASVDALTGALVGER